MHRIEQRMDDLNAESLRLEVKGSLVLSHYILSPSEMLDFIYISGTQGNTLHGWSVHHWANTNTDIHTLRLPLTPWLTLRIFGWDYFYQSGWSNVIYHRTARNHTDKKSQ